MDPWWLRLFQEQRQLRFADVDGARVSLRLPVSDQLINRVLAEGISPEGPVASVTIHALEHNRFAVRIRLVKPTFLPAFEVLFDIETQPHLPQSPVLTLRLASGGLTSLAVYAVQAVTELPPWIVARSDRFEIDLAGLAGRHGLQAALGLLSELDIGTELGRVVISAEAAIREPPTGGVTVD